MAHIDNIGKGCIRILYNVGKPTLCTRFADKNGNLKQGSKVFGYRLELQTTFIDLIVRGTRGYNFGTGGLFAVGIVFIRTGRAVFSRF